MKSILHLVVSRPPPSEEESLHTLHSLQWVFWCNQHWSPECAILKSHARLEQCSAWLLPKAEPYGYWVPSNVTSPHQEWNTIRSTFNDIHLLENRANLAVVIQHSQDLVTDEQWSEKSKMIKKTTVVILFLSAQYTKWWPKLKDEKLWLVTIIILCSSCMELKICNFNSELLHISSQSMRCKYSLQRYQFFNNSIKPNVINKYQIIQYGVQMVLTR